LRVILLEQQTKVSKQQQFQTKSQQAATTISVDFFFH